MLQTAAPPVTQFKWHCVPRNRGLSFGLRSDLSVCLGKTACGSKSAARIVTHRASQVAAKARCPAISCSRLCLMPGNPQFLSNFCSSQGKVPLEELGIHGPTISSNCVATRRHRRLSLGVLTTYSASVLTHGCGRPLIHKQSVFVATGRERAAYLLRFRSVRIDPPGFRSIFADDLPTCPHFAHRAKVDCSVCEFEFGGTHHLARFVARVHRCVEDARGQQGPFHGIRGIAMNEVVLNRMRQRLKQIAILPRSHIEYMTETPSRSSSFFAFRCRLAVVAVLPRTTHRIVTQIRNVRRLYLCNLDIFVSFCGLRPSMDIGFEIER